MPVDYSFRFRRTGTRTVDTFCHLANDIVSFCCYCYYLPHCANDFAVYTWILYYYKRHFSISLLRYFVYFYILSLYHWMLWSATSSITRERHLQLFMPSESLGILFLPLRWRYFLITIPSCIYGNVHLKVQSWLVGPWDSKNSTLFGRIGLGAEIRLLIVCPG